MRHQHSAVIAPTAPDTVFVTVVDAISGVPHVLKLPLNNYEAWMGGAHVQDAFPFLDKGQREILITGIGPASWAKVFGGPAEAIRGFSATEDPRYDQ